MDARHRPSYVLASACGRDGNQAFVWLVRLLLVCIVYRPVLKECGLGVCWSEVDGTWGKLVPSALVHKWGAEEAWKGVIGSADGPGEL